MSDFTKIAVDAMGGDGSPKKIIDGIIHSHKSDKKNFFKIFGDGNQIAELIKIAVDAMGGDGSPKKIIDGIILNHQLKDLSYFYHQRF
mgnify:CR=1 FL=1